jgi:hypothetical protein
MDNRVEFIERTFDFYFEDGFKLDTSSPEEYEHYLNLWFLNAQAFAWLTIGHDLPEDDKVRLMTLIEAARFQVLLIPDYPAIEPDFDFSAYEFPEEFVSAWRGKLVKYVLSQHASPPASA